MPAADPAIVALSGLPATAAADDHLWAFFTKNSGLTPAKDYSVTSHKIAYFRRMLPSSLQHVDDLTRAWTLSGKTYTNALAVLIDNFNRADSTATINPASDGGTWQTPSGTWGILNGQAYNAGGTSGAMAVRDTGSTSHYAEGNFASGTGHVIVVNFSDVNNWYGGVYDQPNGRVNIYRFAGGAAGLIATGVNSGMGPTNVFRLAFDGTTLSASADGIVQWSSSNLGTALPAGTRAGLRADNASGFFDNFKAATL